MIKSKFWRETLFSTVVQLAIEFVLIAIILSLFREGDVVFYGIGGVIILFTIRILSSIFSAVASTPVYFLLKNRLVSEVVAQFYEKNLPTKGNLAYLGASEYMEEIAQSSDTPTPLRRYLDQSLGELSGLRLAGNFVRLLRWNAILDAAIERYVSERNAQGNTQAEAVGAIKVDGKDAEKEEANEADNDGPDEAEKVVNIQTKCQIGTLFAGRMYDPEEDFKDQSARYKRIRDECITLVDRIEDEFYRGAAVHQIIDMCLVAKDLAVFRSLLVSVRDEFLREKIFETAPILRSAESL
jgi:hypothetical protein